MKENHSCAKTIHHVYVWGGSESLSSTYSTRDLTVTATRKLHLGSMPLHYSAWCFSTASPDHIAYGCEECLALAPACSSYPQILETIAVKRLYELVSSNVPFVYSLFKFKLVILVFKKMMLQQVIFISRYRRNEGRSVHS